MAASRQARIAAPHGGRPVSVASVRLPTKAPKLLDLFSGIGGFSLGLERAGFQTVAFCEIEAFPRRVLAHHWPDVPIYDDVRDLTAVRLRADGIGDIDAICGGFPCQDISVAGKGAGLDGERSGLWREFARLVGELRPSYVFVENVGALRARGLASVLGDLAAFGYDAQWHVVPAAAVGAPHLRERVWIVAADANSHGVREQSGRRDGQSGACQVQPADHGAEELDPDAIVQRQRECGRSVELGTGHSRSEPDGLGPGDGRIGAAAADAQRIGRPHLRGLQRRLAGALAAASTPWDRTLESPLCGLDDGIPARVARPQLKALGNAVVPQIPEILGRAVLEAA